MKRFLALFVLWGLSLTGCQTASSVAAKASLPTLGAAIFLDDAATHTARLERFLAGRTQLPEREKINFLLESLRSSSCRFVRNGDTYKPDEAMRWLRWKMGHRQYRNHPIRTARDFVDRVADRSVNTGRPYEAILPDGRHVAMQALLANELNALEKAFGR